MLQRAKAGSGRKNFFKKVVEGKGVSNWHAAMTWVMSVRLHQGCRCGLQSINKIRLNINLATRFTWLCLYSRPVFWFRKVFLVSKRKTKNSKTYKHFLQRRSMQGPVYTQLILYKFSIRNKITGKPRKLRYNYVGIKNDLQVH